MVDEPTSSGFWTAGWARIPRLERMKELSPSKITAWLDCAHYLTLRHEVDRGVREEPSPITGSFAELVTQKGNEHEENVLRAYEEAGEVLNLGGRAPGESMATSAKRAAPHLDASEAPVLFQVPLVHDGVRGVADFLERTALEDGQEVWTPVDAKLARTEAKPGHVLQLCFYAEAIESLTGVTPQELKVSLGSGNTQTVRFDDVRPYWERLKTQLATAVADGSTGETRPEPCSHCDFCEFQAVCDRQWRDEDSLVFVAGVTKADRAALEESGVTTLAGLAKRVAPVEHVAEARLERLRTQAALQVERLERPDDKPPYRMIEPGDDPVWGRGLEKLPEPDDADVFLDFEGHPFWKPDRGLFFLFGYIAKDLDGDGAGKGDGGGEWHFHELWAHDPEEEGERVGELVRLLAERRAAHPGMHVYHYNHTERSSLESLTTEYAVAETALDNLLREGAFVDLLPIVRNSLQAGVEGYGLKHVERLTDYERSHEIDQGAGAVVAFDKYEHDGDEAHLRDIATYNEDDVRATRALRDWLLEQRPEGFEPVAPTAEDERQATDIDELLERLSGAESGTPDRLVADLLGYWIRELRVYQAEVHSALSASFDEQIGNESVVAGLGGGTLVEAKTPTGRKAKWPTMRFTLPEQPVPSSLVNPDKDQEGMFVAPDGALRYVGIRGVDPTAQTIDVVWDEDADAAGLRPASIAHNEWVRASSKSAAIVDLAQRVLAGDDARSPNPATMALLEAAPPRFVAGGGPADGRFTDDPKNLAAWVQELDRSVLAVQGPPGTGKTYRGAHMVRALIKEGRRVGIMSMSHKAIDNFVAEVLSVCDDDPDADPRVIRRRSKPKDGGLEGVTYVNGNDRLGSEEFNVVAGTAWAFSSKPARGKPVDVLFIDEAGQLSLADAAAGSNAARSVVLLGDPLQLEQVAKASHPGGSGASALTHMLGENETMPPERGVFIEETRRMHPDVCGFISRRIYGGRLHSHESCSNQGTELGTGLRWLRVDHEGCSTESPQEADAVLAQVRDLLGRGWTDNEGQELTLGPDDIMVVAPYNDQVNLIRSTLGSDPATAGVTVGTVDKFQGRQAAVVIFSMASSSSADMPRGPEFLFSRNRLNVAVSRAKCLAYLVCSDELLNSRARTVDDMYLIATLCAFVDAATEVTSPEATDP